MIRFPRRARMRLPVVLVLIGAAIGTARAAPAPAPAAAADFKGDWVGWVCPAGQAVDPAHCSSLVLSLFQQGTHVCGAHLFATPGAGALDEGGTPSITGSIDGNAAHASVVSQRGSTPLELRVDLQREGEALLWRRLESPKGDYLLPLTARLKRSRKGAVLGDLVAQRLSAVCGSALAMANQAPTGSAPGTGTAGALPAGAGAGSGTGSEGGAAGAPQIPGRSIPLPPASPGNAQ